MEPPEINKVVVPLDMLPSQSVRSCWDKTRTVRARLLPVTHFDSAFAEKAAKIASARKHAE